MTERAKGLDEVRIGRIAIGVLGVVVATGYFVMALQMPFGSARQPGPGMFPVAVGAAGVVISLLVIGEALFTRSESGRIERPDRARAKQVGGFFLLTCAYVILLPLLGQYIAASLYIMAMLWLLGRLAWWKILVYGIVAAVATSWLFMEVLGVSLPEGFWA